MIERYTGWSVFEWFGALWFMFMVLLFLWIWFYHDDMGGH